MIFLGQASNYTFGRAIRHLFAHGKPADSQRLRQALAKRYGSTVERTGLYHTGRSALSAAIAAVTPSGSKVLIPGLTCIAVVRAVKAAGCTPVFADIDPETLQYDFKSIDKYAKVCYNGSIVVQNTLGLPLEMSQIEAIAKQYHLHIIEDLAHSAGRYYPDGREVGTVGEAIALSFGKGKAIDTIAGGALVVRDESAKMPAAPTQLAKRSERWRERWYPLFGWSIRAMYHLGLGKCLTAVLLKLHWIERSADAELNLQTKLTDWQAKLALRQLETLPRTPLREYHLVSERERLLAKLEQRGYFLREIWYDTPVSPARYAKEADFPVADCPNTVKVAAEIINLPTWYDEQRLAPARVIIEQHMEEYGRA